MKKNLLMLAVVVLTALTMNAELSQSVVATLTHGTTVTTYTGGNALKMAHNAAVEGDAIVLSPGTFNAVDITKAITLRGAGATDLSLPDQQITSAGTTYITGNMNVNITSTTGTLIIENCRFSGRVEFKKAPVTKVYKSYFSTIYVYSDVASADFTHCLLSEWHASGSEQLCKNVNMLNSYAFCEYFNPYIKATNCVLYASYYKAWNHNDTYVNDATGGILENCILLCYSSVYGFENLSPYSQARNCVAVKMGSAGFGDFFQYSNNGSNKVINDAAVLLSTTSWPFTLTESGAATYLGGDGTQVGIHGGALPFDPIPDNLLVTTCNIAPKTTADGKLSVEIKVSTVK